MRRCWIVVLASLVVLGAFASLAAAAIEVRPKRVAAGEDVRFVLRIHSLWPEANTQAVKIQFPEEVAALAFEAPPLGWSIKPLKSGNGDTVGVMYHGGYIPENTHQDFVFAARTVTAGRTLWLAEQFYDNGVVARFSVDPAVGSATDDVNADGPAAIVEIVGDVPVPSQVAPSPGATDTPQVPTQEPAVVATDDGGGSGFGPAERLGLALLFVGLLAFVVVFMLSRTNAGFTPSQPDEPV